MIKPSFIIVGEQKSGTTSLYGNLLKHPQIVPLDNNSYAHGMKELRYFDKPPTANLSMEVYMKNFMSLYDAQKLKGNDKYLITGERFDCIYSLKALLDI